MKTSKVLKRARKALETTGWVQGSYADFEYDGKQPVCIGFCALGAIRFAATGKEEVHDETELAFSEFDAEQLIHIQRAEHALRIAYGANSLLYYNGLGIPGWNDQLNRTKTQVIDAFKAAEKQAKEWEVAESA